MHRCVGPNAYALEQLRWILDGVLKRPIVKNRKKHRTNRLISSALIGSRKLKQKLDKLIFSPYGIFKDMKVNKMESPGPIIKIYIDFSLKKNTLCIENFRPLDNLKLGTSKTQS